eukprot:UN26107
MTTKKDDKLWNIYELSESMPYNPNGYYPRMGGDLGYSNSLWLIQLNEVAHLSGIKGNYIIVDRTNSLVISVTNDEPDDHPTAKEYYEVVKRAII